MTEQKIYAVMIMVGLVGMIEPRSFFVMLFGVSSFCYLMGIPLR